MTEVDEKRIVLMLCVFPDGRMDGWYEVPPEGSIPVDTANEYYDQVWLFPGWSPSPSNLRRIEDDWRESELIVIAAQLDALEEVEAGDTPPDVLAGTRTQWLKYRGLVRNWAEGKGDYPDMTMRPKRPS